MFFYVGEVGEEEDYQNDILDRKTLATGIIIYGPICKHPTSAEISVLKVLNSPGGIMCLMRMSFRNKLRKDLWFCV